MLHGVRAAGGDPSNKFCESHIRQASPGCSHMFHSTLQRANESTLRTSARSVFNLHISSHLNSGPNFDPNVMNS